MKAVEQAMGQKAWVADEAVAATAAPGARAEAALLAQMQEMGFPATQAAQALVYTGNTGVQQAINWLMEHKEGSALPFAMPDDTGATAPEARDDGRPSVFTSHNAGISGILRRQQEEASAAESSLKSAFADLKNLEEKAREMVSLAERFRSALMRNSDGSVAGTDGEAQAAMEEELISMGIASPVTKDTAGRLYHRELSRQLSDFLAAPLGRAGGMMTLQEVYCLFNRARGAELVSPDDLMEAVKLFPSIGCPLLLLELDSKAGKEVRITRMQAIRSRLTSAGAGKGTLIICAASLDNEKVSAELLRLVRPPGTEGLGVGITERDAARCLGVSIMVAREHILSAEDRCVLCRDDSAEGLRFFYNFLLDPALVPVVH
mmetsp:Transcript_19693/g.54686  ORF Transcript_19693/g.54686 Transcript_19693/m.54686 type:complete len:376 (+) Transcript_19693:78-1205(+)